ncbi:uncharacterized protein YALI1_D33179g [Yarrowia lipolytica]|uniref:Uncharacterized protein n=1 Tax=Yarrowia lipolytica TaxID=4952 RepID=A0A1D8NG85_YARLL|nr:hypothetical protein YALI1_D33179g [Yarrowia lipolytica]
MTSVEFVVGMDLGRGADLGYQYMDRDSGQWTVRNAVSRRVRQSVRMSRDRGLLVCLHSGFRFRRFVRY